MNPAPRLRTAAVDDAAEIARLSTQLGYPATADVMRGRLAALLSNPAHRIVVADDGAALAGWIAAEHRCALESGASIEIVGLVVDEAAHRRGIGRALVMAVQQWADERGEPRITVRSSIARNQSHPFYAGLGFVRSKTQHVYVRDATHATSRDHH